MNNRFAVIALGLVGGCAGLTICAGCGDLGGNRRQASGSVAGTGLAGSGMSDLAAGPAQPSTTPASAMPAGAPAPGQPVVGQPAAPAAGQPAGALPGSPMAGAPQAAGPLSGLPGVAVGGPPQTGVVTEKAEAGVTGKGNYGGPGMVTTPISVYFQAREQIIFLTVQQALNLYEGEHGHKPKTEDEFMKQVIEFNQIKLPQLPPGSKYKYDPQKGELMVERPQ